MKRAQALVALVVVVALASACKGKEKSASEPSAGSPAARGATASGAPGGAGAPAVSTAAPGAGDKSGKSIANAMALEKGKPIDIVVPCKGNMYLGPFTFAKDPSKIEVGAELSVVVDEQICAGGWWVDGKETFIEHARVGCVEKANPRKEKFSVEYSPSNGGSGANPVYLKLGFDEPAADGCQAPHIKLSLP